MDRSTHPDELKSAVIAQADLRVRFGLPLALVCIGVYLFGPTEAVGHNLAVVSMLGLYFAYAFLTRYFSRRSAPFSPWDLVLITAVLDPLLLSSWMFVSGHTSVLFVGFYLFTILGFGLRIGAVAMHLCQVMSLVGFGVVLVSSPEWREHALYALSHVILLIAVPLYGATLIRKIQTAKSLAEFESKAKSQLLAKVSHELRTPLTGIVSAAQLIELESREAPAINRAGSILHLAQALDAEIRQLLDLSKLDAGKDLSPETAFNVDYAADYVIKAIEPIAASKQLAVQLDFDERIRFPVQGHFQELTGVLINLAGNAVKFTAEGTIGLRVELIDETPSTYRIRFGISDTGIGIAPEHQERIFEPFYQVESGAQRKFGGTGLGAAIARELVRKMGGDITVESIEGLGSVFSFELAMTIDQASSTPVVVAPEVAAPTVSPKKILVADDNTLNLNLIREMLEKDGHVVSTAIRGEDAIRKLAAENFDVVFLDYNMGDMDGATVYQTYTFGRVKTAPTFFLTADTTSITRRLLEDLGSSGVLYKPVTLDKLRGALAGLFAGDVVHGNTAPARSAARGPHLSPVPVEYIDGAAIEALREIKDNPEFLYSMITDGMGDLVTLNRQLLELIAKVDTPAIHRQAHAMKGVAVSVGAIRLATLADRLMSITEDQLAADPSRWKADLSDTTTRSLAALDEIRNGFAQARVANH